MQSIFVVTPPAFEPVALDDAKQWLRIEGSFTDDDQLITALIQVARSACEDFTGRVFVSQQWQQNLDTFPYNSMFPSPTQIDGYGVDPSIYLLRSPIISVDQIQYNDTDSGIDILPSYWYTVDGLSLPPRIYPAYGYYWPPTLPVINAVTINFTAGYPGAAVPAGSSQTQVGAAANIPVPIILAIKQTLSWLYNRPETDTNMSGEALPLVAKALLSPYKVWS